MEKLRSKNTKKRKQIKFLYRQTSRNNQENASG